ncbi:MAG: hypothetical protein DRQ40_00790 [Gammaproteobacteria bacterium]|nr:MAG: hypothetical protein DRQ40_00790 [Gammaproteobacteria bacterium]
MKVRLNPGGWISEYQYSEKVRLTKQWQTVPSKMGKAMLQLQYKGRPMVESDEAEAGEAEVEDPVAESEDAEQEGES